MIFVLSVRHTGTFFVYEELLKRQATRYHFGERYWHQADGDVIVPLRSLDSIIQSWDGRQLDPKDLDKALCEMTRYVRKNKPYILPIDHDNRQEYLDRINEGLGLSLKTDWPVINKKNFQSPLGSDFSVCERHRPFFDRIYRA